MFSNFENFQKTVFENGEKIFCDYNQLREKLEQNYLTEISLLKVKEEIGNPNLLYSFD